MIAAPDPSPPIPDDRPRPPRARTVFRNILLQAFWISLGYAVIGILVEGLRRLTGKDFWNQATQFVDSVALMLLKKVGLIEPLIDLAAHHRLGGFAMRLIISGVTVLAIFAQGVLLACVLYAIQRFNRKAWPRLG